MNGFPVESVIYKYQQGYYNALTVSNNNNDSTVFIEFMLEAILQALEEYQQDTLVEEGRGAPRYYQFFNREFAWASSVKGTNNKYDYYVETGEKKIERQIKTNVDFSDGELKIEKIEEDVVINVTKLIASLFPAHIQFLWEEEYDFSKDDTISFDIPCPELISKLNLSQKDYDGYFYSPTGELVAFDGNVTNSIDGLVIRKDFLDKFLEENGLSIIWDFVGEKQYFTQNPREQYYCRWDGIFWEEKHSVKNKICINEQKTCEKD